MELFEYDEELEKEENIDFETQQEDYILYCEDIYGMIKKELNKYNFYYYNITLKNGYYEGFYINIENNFPICYDDHNDKKEAQKELTTIKAFLHFCVDNGLNVCFPSWCTSYLNYKESNTAIDEAIKEEREKVKDIPTWLYYEQNRSCRKSA